MNTLARADLNQINLDQDSFVGRAIAAGLEYGQLPPGFIDGLKTYLRMRGMGFAQRQRRGIALSKDQLRHGIEMGLVCIDLALEQESAGDLNRAVQLLVAGQFEPLYSRGWELACKRLEQLRQRALELSRRAELGFWPEIQTRVEAWGRLTPENWTAIDGEGKLVAVDIAADGAELYQLENKVFFLRSLPERSLQDLLKIGALDFSNVLQRVAMALAMGRVSLVVDLEQVRSFGTSSFVEGVLRPELRRQVLEQVAVHLEKILPDGEVRTQIVTDFHQALEGLERAVAGGYLEELLLPLESYPEADWEETEEPAVDGGDEPPSLFAVSNDDEPPDQLFTGGSAEEVF